MSILLALIFSAQLSAQHLSVVCENAYLSLPNGNYQSNPPIFHGDFLARRTQETELGLVYVVEGLQGEKIYHSTDRIFDLMQIDNHLVLLLAYQLRVINLDGVEVAKFDFSPLPYRSSHGRSMVKVGEVIYIARGAGGVSAFSIDELRVIWDADLRDISKGGSAEAIVYDGKSLQIVASTTQENGFTGVITMNLEGKIQSTMPYDTRRSGVIAPGARARWFKDTLFINNLGWIHTFNSTQIMQARVSRPRWIAHQVRERNNQFHYMMLTGDMMIKENRLVGCGLTYAEPARQRVSKLFEITL